MKLTCTLVLLGLGCDASARISLLEPEARAAEAGAGTMAMTMDAGTQPVAGRAAAGRAAPTAGALAGAPAQPQAGRRGGDEPIGGLILRYDFSGEGKVVRDLVGDADATLQGDAVLARNRDFIVLDGRGDYVNLPNGIVSALESATFIAWVAWDGGDCWQRVFDFGASTAGEDMTGEVESSLFMTPYACGFDALMVMAEFGRIQYQLYDDEVLPVGFTFQLALVVDAERQLFTLYRDTMAVAEAPAPFALSELNDVNNWLGRSQWAQDRTDFTGIYGEFRIYDRALSADEIAMLYRRGPNGL